MPGVIELAWRSAAGAALAALMSGLFVPADAETPGLSTGYPLAQDCNAIAASHDANVSAARHARSICPISTPSEPGWALPVCKFYVRWAESCVPAALAACAAEDARDQEVARCRAQEQVQQQIQAAEERKRLRGYDEASEAAGELNDLRGGDSAAHELSRDLTEQALAMLDAQTEATFREFDEAFEDFERDSPGKSFIDHAIEQNTFVPMGDNANPPPEPARLPEDVTEMLDLAAATEGKAYDLPLGDSFTSSGAGEEALEIATESALNGDISVFESGGDPGALLKPLSGVHSTVSPPTNTGFDAVRARQILDKIEVSDQTREEAREATEGRVPPSRQPSTNESERAAISCTDCCTRWHSVAYGQARQTVQESCESWCAAGENWHRVWLFEVIGERGYKGPDRLGQCGVDY